MAKDKVADPVGQALIIAARRHRSRQAEMLAGLGLFPGQDQVLRALFVQDGLTMSEIAEQLQIRPPTASKMAARMGAQGLVERRASSEDARIVTIHITDAGRNLNDEVQSISRLLEKRLLQDMDSKDGRRLRRLLRKVARNLKSGTECDDGTDPAEPDTDDGG
jgi:DNA-binding MarR family transcriptional regulator